jgi:hypothetical protein
VERSDLVTWYPGLAVNKNICLLIRVRQAGDDTVGHQATLYVPRPRVLTSSQQTHLSPTVLPVLVGTPVHTSTEVMADWPEWQQFLQSPECFSTTRRTGGSAGSQTTYVSATVLSRLCGEEWRGGHHPLLGLPVPGTVHWYLVPGTSTKW